MASVSKHIRQLRTARGMTQEELAQKLYVTRQTISAWETGRSQPDLGTLEQIAAALGVEVTEVIYGPQAGLEEQRRKWVRHGISIGVILCLVWYVLFECGIWRTALDGLSYQFSDADYRVAGEVIPGSWSVTLDLADPYASRGTVLYEDDSCRITVGPLDWDSDGDKAWNLWFRAEGSCAPWGSSLVTGVLEQQTEKTASVTVTIDGVTRPGRWIGNSVISKEGTNFGCTLFHSNTWEDRPESVTVTVEDLMRFTTRRAG